MKFSRNISFILNFNDILFRDHETPYMFFFANKSENPLSLNYTERKSLKSTIFLKKSSMVTPNMYSHIH